MLLRQAEQEADRVSDYADYLQNARNADRELAKAGDKRSYEPDPKPTAKKKPKKGKR